MAGEDLVVRADDPEYLEQAAAEAAFWDTYHPFGVEAWEELPEGPVNLYSNERFTGDRRVPWYETIHRHGPFKRGLILGTSGLRTEAHILSSNPGLHVTFVDISPGALERRMQALGERFPGRLSTRLADLNFVDLEPCAYDVIISSATMHHLLNLEHAAAQVNHALTEDGMFFLNDYVGENRSMPTPEKRRVFEAFDARDCRRAGMAPRPVQWLEEKNLSPFCGVRSQDVLDVFGRTLNPIEVRTSSALLMLLLRTRRPGREYPPPGLARFSVRVRNVGRRLVRGRRQGMERNWIDPRFLEELKLGDLLADAGVIQPGVAFATYRRRSGGTAGKNICR